MTQGVSPDARGFFAQGVTHHQAGRFDEAITCYRQALALQPNLVAAYNNLADALCARGKLEEAEACYRQALALQAGRAELHNNLGAVLFEQGKLDDAVNCYHKALALEPGHAEVLNNLGAALHRQGKLDEAEASIRRALALAPDFTQALHNLGALLIGRSQSEQAIAVYRQILRINPRDDDALDSLAEALAASGDAVSALETIRASLQSKETARAKRLFGEIVAALRWAEDNDQVRKLMVRALMEPWIRPATLARTSAGLIKQNAKVGACIARAAHAWPRLLATAELLGPDGMPALVEDELLRALLVSTQNTDVELERFLTMARRLLLEAAASGSEDEAGLEFYAALARQCFINEYVFSHDEDEISRARKLCDTLTVALANGAPISCLHLLAVAAYFPLHSVSGARDLPNLPWPDSIAALLILQLREPNEETRLRAGLPKLTSIEDSISRLVQDHYEENPYPRWVRIPQRENAITIAAYLRHKFPFAPLVKGRGEGISEILSAGCGTGQLTLELAQSTASRVLAIDLSRKSLSYAQRKAAGLGLTTVTFAQADVLGLGAIGGSFDVIESSGVLHHMADPFAGWRMLLMALRPGGFMTLGLYSKMARQGVVEARRHIAQWGYGTSADDIRRCRQDLLDSNRNDDLGIAASDDFFGISSCRDLLFHGQEKRMELPAIEAFLQENDLTFLGFETDQATLAAYRRRFPDDLAATDLQNWHLFEREMPDTFSGMYRFWIQKKS